MSIEQMRAEVIKLYPGNGWKTRVLNMSEAQIIAIYNRQIKNRR
jgi:hypothetical protein